ncbi:unnamed protein product [Arabis nemorensis]|uniref:Uncharacterized protein n=1 Tax=Arabis nemorensis TaxID=586526 RepID=A0A565APG3_9BRAS|nr:unnamed protein product [Arabis nemorensis]
MEDDDEKLEEVSSPSSVESRDEEDASPHSEPIPFQARVRYLPKDTRVFDVNPKPQPKP